MDNTKVGALAVRLNLNFLEIAWNGVLGSDVFVDLFFMSNVL